MWATRFTRQQNHIFLDYGFTDDFSTACRRGCCSFRRDMLQRLFVRQLRAFRLTQNRVRFLMSVCINVGCFAGVNFFFVEFLVKILGLFRVAFFVQRFFLGFFLVEIRAASQCIRICPRLRLFVFSLHQPRRKR